jgi:hypothetical protein
MQTIIDKVLPGTIHMLLLEQFDSRHALAVVWLEFALRVR